MGHTVILVIGDDYEDQLDKFQNSEHADPQNRHWVTCDVLVSTIKAYEERPPNDVWGDVSFLDWVRKSFCIRVLEEQQEPDLAGLDRNGWIRLGPDGQVSELIHRSIPNGFFDFVSSEVVAFPLKKDRKAAIDIAREKARLKWEFRKRLGILRTGEQEPEAIDADGFTFTDSAAKRDIDFESMRAAIRAAAEERWEHAANACGSQKWKPFDVIWEKYRKANYSDAAYYAAINEWSEQAAVKAILATTTMDVCDSRIADRIRMEKMAAIGLWTNATHEAIDQLGLSRETYTKKFGLWKILGYTDVIMHGEHLKEFNEDQLFSSIPEETILTLVSAHC
ncbi:MAG: hypothetical protein H6R18_2267 [Proteobacteria bacterium]|nr:hypothetical protein [Pseudomonadota bacterium]